MADFIIIVVILLCLGTAIAFSLFSKRNGNKCSGCQFAATCEGKNCPSEKSQNPSEK